ncbi:metal-dependent hydrolase [Novosphingobium guangzhouense]|uniref:Metal-dependent hydrolase n=1 Tax=Novosphingobium guangzhouense TaxID=1850347 RepID=A0A2K2FVS2_9SPHN|nr:metal-dependent hydrolase [Novosphingobium guangzhouense]PNU02848.1 metal-dependent hydrolase [Novosphingobium guangzhouense]
MDNLTHSLVGWVLAETGLKRRTRKGLAACVLAANMPDIDVFFGWAPWAPLAMHRGFTHGLVGGVLLMPPVLAGLLWLLDRWQASRGATFGSGLPMRFGWLLALCYLGALTHPLLDLQNVYAVQLLSPSSGRWFHTDGLFIVSPWLLAIMGLGLWLARRWRSTRPAIAALAGVVGFIAINIGISAAAWDAPLQTDPAFAPDRIFASPEPLLFWRRDMIWRQAGRISYGRYDPFRHGGRLVSADPPVPDNMADPLVRKAAVATPEAIKFLAWSQLPMARIERKGCGAVVTFGDARFTGPRLSRNFNVSVKVPGDCPAR